MIFLICVTFLGQTHHPCPRHENVPKKHTAGENIAVQKKGNQPTNMPLIGECKRHTASGMGGH